MNADLQTGIVPDNRAPVTRFGLLPRIAGMTVEAFQEHWRTTHAELALELMPEMDRYWQNHRIIDPSTSCSPWPGFDACSEIDAPSVAAHLAMRTSAAFFERAAEEDPKILDESKAGAVWARSISSEGDVGSGVRLLTFLRRAPMHDQAELAHALTISPAAASGRGREVFLALTGSTAGQVWSVYDAVEAIWFADADEAFGYLTSPQAERDATHLAGIVRGREQVLVHVIVVV
jgi:hypothetical protein